jgi:hypothetical protein
METEPTGQMPEPIDLQYNSDFEPAPQEPPKRKRGNPNFVKGRSGNPSGKPAPPTDAEVAELASARAEIEALKAELEKREEQTARKELKAARAAAEAAEKRVRELEAELSAKNAPPTDEGMRLAEELVDRCLREGL